MTVITGIRGLNMGGGFAGGGAAVMAGHAAAGDGAVIEHGAGP